jgi:hypothetical protein
LVLPACVRGVCLRALLPSTFVNRARRFKKADEKTANPLKAFGGLARKGNPRHCP